MEIPSSELEVWLTELKPYQKKIVEVLVEKYGEEEAIEKWLDVNGPEKMVQFGGEQKNKVYSERVKKEINKFLCGNKEYEKERKECKKYEGNIRSFLVSTISAAVGTKLGIASIIIAPVVVLVLFTAGKIGLNAYCNVE